MYTLLLSVMHIGPAISLFTFPPYSIIILYLLDICMNECVKVYFLHFLYILSWRRRYRNLAMPDPFAVYIMQINMFKSIITELKSGPYIVV